MFARSALVALLALAGVATVEVSTARAAEWVPCARENGYCRVPYPTVVRYGARGSFSEARVDGSVRCNNDNFSDPIGGVPKACFYLVRDREYERPAPRDWDRPAPRDERWERPRDDRWDRRPPRDEWSGGGGWQPCARENEYCDFRGRAEVRYGARGSYITRRAVDGVSCDNETFGRDPARGVPKHCEVRR